MAAFACADALPNKSFPCQHLTHGAPRRPSRLGILGFEQSEEFVSTPGRMTSPRRQQRLAQRLGGLRGRVRRTAGAISETARAVLLITCDSFVRGFATDVIAHAEFGKRERVA